MLDSLPALEERDRRGQGDGPESEHHLDLAEEVEQFGAEARRFRSARLALAGVVSVLDVVGESSEALCGEGVDDGQHEDGRGRDVERDQTGSGGQDLENAGPGWAGYWSRGVGNAAARPLMPQRRARGALALARPAAPVSTR